MQSNARRQLHAGSPLFAKITGKRQLQDQRETTHFRICSLINQALTAIPYDCRESTGRRSPSSDQMLSARRYKVHRNCFGFRSFIEHICTDN